MSVRREGDGFLGAERLMATSALTGDVSRDGERFLLAVPESDWAGEIQVVTTGRGWLMVGRTLGHYGSLRA